MSLFFFFNDTATTEIYTLSLHDALPISLRTIPGATTRCIPTTASRDGAHSMASSPRAIISSFRNSSRSEEHTSELQSRLHLVCRLLLEKKKNKPVQQTTHH